MAETRLDLRYRFGAHIAPLAAGAPAWTARSRHDVAVPLHDHDFLEVELVEDGAAEHVSIHGRERVAAGHVLVLHPGQWHGYERPRGLELRDAYVRVELFARELAWLRDDPRLAPLVPSRVPRDDRERRAAPQGVLSLRCDRARFAAVGAACDALAATGAGRRGALVARVLDLLEALADHPEVARRAGRVDPAIDDVLAAMALDLRRPWSLAELARRAALSEPQLVRRVRRATGRSPLRWLAERRAERLAVLLLSDPRPVARLGREVGWDDPSYCARRFRACFGCAPDAYRRRRGA